MTDDTLKPLTIEGRRGEFIFDVESFVRRLLTVMQDEMAKFGAKTPTCIRCGEKPFVMPRNVSFHCSSDTWKLTVERGKNDSQHADVLRFNTAGWRTLEGGDHEALCPDCLQFVKTVGKDGGA